MVGTEYDGEDTVLKDKDAKVLNERYVLMPDKLGRLGNWMFQFAFMFSVAKKLNYKFIIRSKHRLTRAFDFPNVSDMPLDNLIVVNQSQWENKTWHEDADYLSHNLTIIGYFQRFTYFVKYAKEIREIFKVKPKYLEMAKTFIDANTPKKKTLIGIHVRRGDFLYRNALNHGKLGGDQEFFNKSMNYYRRLYSDAIFVVVSDDQPWCQRNIVGPYVRYSSFREAIVDLAIMTLSDHTIITAGTFSWWAGFLAGGTVVYLADYPIPGSPQELKVILRREYYYLPEWIPIANGNRAY